MRKLLTIFLVLGSVSTANAWGNFQTDYNAALLGLTLPAFTGYPEINQAYLHDGKDIAYNQYATNSDFYAAYDSKFGHMPNPALKSNYNDMNYYIQTFNNLSAANSNLTGMLNQSELSGFTNSHYNQVGYPRSQFFSP